MIKESELLSVRIIEDKVSSINDKIYQGQNCYSIEFSMKVVQLIRIIQDIKNRSINVSNNHEVVINFRIGKRSKRLAEISLVKTMGFSI